jgi:hypothetical protein
MPGINFRRVFTAAGLTALILVYFFLWVRMISTPAERTGSDFISAYSSGRVAQRWGPANVYNLDFQQTIQEEVVGFNLASGQVLMFNHPPFLVPFLALLMDGNYIGSLLRYALVIVLLYAAALAAAWHLLSLEGWRHGAVALVVAGFATFYPLFVSLINTQDTALMVLGGVLVLFGLLTGRDWLAGFGLALTTIRPHVAVLLAFPFLFRKQRVFLWFGAAAVVLGLVSWLAVGSVGMQAYLHLLLTAAGGQFYGMQEAAMVNLTGLLTRLAPGIGIQTIHWIGWIFFGLTLIGLCVAWARSREIGEKQIGLAVTLAVFAAPHLHYHDLTLLVVALLALLLGLVRGRFLEDCQAAHIPLALSLLLLFSNFAPITKYNFPYLIMLLLVLTLWIPGKFIRGGQHSGNKAS